MVSIRLKSGGHTFSPATLPAVKEGGVEVVISTTNTALVPETLFEPADPAVVLAAVGMTPAANERVVYSKAVDGIIAVMTIDASALEAIEVQYGDRVNFLSPLQLGTRPERGTLLELDDDVLYVRVYDDAMLFAEAMAVDTDADILYYLESINRVYNIYNMYARATGDTKRLKSLVKSLFRNLEIVK